MEYASWIFMIIALVGMILNARMKVAGFLVWIVSNLGFVTLNLIEHKYVLVTLFVANMCFSVCGIAFWNKKRKTVKKNEDFSQWRIEAKRAFKV